jgi:hypothetical protein
MVVLSFVEGLKVNNVRIRHQVKTNGGGKKSRRLVTETISTEGTIELKTIENSRKERCSPVTINGKV